MGVKSSDDKSLEHCLCNFNNAWAWTRRQNCIWRGVAKVLVAVDKLPVYDAFLCQSRSMKFDPRENYLQ